MKEVNESPKKYQIFRTQPEIRNMLLNWTVPHPVWGKMFQSSVVLRGFAKLQKYKDERIVFYEDFLHSFVIYEAASSFIAVDFSAYVHYYLPNNRKETDDVIRVMQILRELCSEADLQQAKFKLQSCVKYYWSHYITKS